MTAATAGSRRGRRSERRRREDVLKMTTVSLGLQLERYEIVPAKQLQQKQINSNEDGEWDLYLAIELTCSDSA